MTSLHLPPIESLDVEDLLTLPEGYRYELHEGNLFIVTPSTNPDELTRALLTLHAQPELRERMGQASRARILRDFSWPAMVHAYEMLLAARSVAAHA